MADIDSIPSAVQSPEEKLLEAIFGKANSDDNAYAGAKRSNASSRRRALEAVSYDLSLSALARTARRLRQTAEQTTMDVAVIAAKNDRLETLAHSNRIAFCELEGWLKDGR